MGLALLECGASADDPAVKFIADTLRLQQNQLFQTYELSLAIMFFDRLGKAADRPLIYTLGNRLCDGQQEDGTWSYQCRSRLANVARRPPRGFRPAPIIRGRGDHSNTQFAVLGLWIAGRHNVSVHDALARTDHYFQEIQDAEGSWGYRFRMSQHRDSMTCAALMSLALGFASHKRTGALDATWINRSKSVDRGFGYLTRSLESLLRGQRHAVWNRILGADSGGDIYFLWSLERLAVAHNLKVIGGRAWYPWAAELLVNSQRGDGSWQDARGGPIDTCFALLVLKRSNFTPDLTRMMATNRVYPGLPLRPGLLEKDRNLDLGIPVVGRPAPNTAPLAPGLIQRPQTSPDLVGPPIPEKQKSAGDKD
jgi:hypothetical protein